MPRETLIERFFTTLISGDRVAGRQVIDQLIDEDCPADKVVTHLLWPTLQHIQNLHRADQLSQLAHNYSTRLLRLLTEQMQLRLEQQPRIGRRVLVACGAEQAEELGAMMCADLIEAAGYEVFFVGGGIANDELVAQLGELNPQIIVIFGVVPATVPQTRLLIDRLQEIGACPEIQIVVGGGVFNRADGLAEEIGADLWATDPQDLVKVISEQPDRRMAPDQRTVGRRRRIKREAA